MKFFSRFFTIIFLLNSVQTLPSEPAARASLSSSATVQPVRDVQKESKEGAANAAATANTAAAKTTEESPQWSAAFNSAQGLSTTWTPMAISGAKSAKTNQNAQQQKTIVDEKTMGEIGLLSASPAPVMYVVNEGFSPEALKEMRDEEFFEKVSKEQEEIYLQVLLDCPKDIKDIITLHKKNKRRKALNNILLFGPSRTGKTTIAKAFAYACNLPCRFISAQFLCNTYQNGGESNLKEIFDQVVEKAPCVLVVDEFETLLNKHDKPNTGDQNILRAFWSIVDECAKHKIYVVCTLNQATELPATISSRFPAVFKVDLPNEVQTKKVIKFYLEREKKNQNVMCDQEVCKQLEEKCSYSDSVKNLFVSSIISKSKGFSHRMLESLVEYASIAADLRDSSTPVITVQDFYNAVPKVKELHKDAISKKTWGQWCRENHKFLIGTGITVAAIGISAYFAYKSYKLGEKTRDLAIEGDKTAKASLKVAEEGYKLAQTTATATENLNNINLELALETYRNTRSLPDALLIALHENGRDLRRYITKERFDVLVQRGLIKPK
jgi:hypothetical protein